MTPIIGFRGREELWGLRWLVCDMDERARVKDPRFDDLVKAREDWCVLLSHEVLCGNLACVCVCVCARVPVCVSI